MDGVHGSVASVARKIKFIYEIKYFIHLDNKIINASIRKWAKFMTGKFTIGNKIYKNAQIKILI